MGSLAPVAIGSVALLAALFPCFYVAYYLRTKVRQRRAEIQQLFGTRSDAAAERLAEMYQAVFPTVTHRAASAGDGLVARMDTLHARSRYAFAGACAWLPTTIGLALVVAWCIDGLEGRESSVAAIPVPLLMAFLGGYVWSLYELLSSGSRGDLVPSRLFDLAFRTLASVPIGYAFSLIVVEQAMSFAAFAASAFPLRDLRLFVRSEMLQRLDGGAARPAGRRADDLKDLVQGLGADTLARLKDMEISTTLDLAYADPMAIMVKTGFSFKHVLDWIDQSLLALYAGERVSALAPRGVRSALEASHVYSEHVVTGYGTAAEAVRPAAELDADLLVKGMADTLGISTSELAHMLAELDGDPHLQLISLFWGEE